MKTLYNFFKTKKKTMEEHFKDYYNNDNDWNEFKKMIGPNNFTIQLGDPKKTYYVPTQTMDLNKCLFPNDLLSNLSDLFYAYFNNKTQVQNKFNALIIEIKKHMNNKLHDKPSYKIKCYSFGKKTRKTRKNRSKKTRKTRSKKIRRSKKTRKTRN